MKEADGVRKLPACDGKVTDGVRKMSYGVKKISGRSQMVSGRCKGC